MGKIFAVAAAALILCCDAPSGPDWAEPESIQFDASLSIDLGQMNRTASGLYWQDLEVGTGLTTAIGHIVVVHYSVWLPDGRRVQTSRATGNPVEFRVHDGIVVAGMDEGVVGMQEGGRRKFVMRPELAFGRRGKDPVPPLTTLVYEVELVSIRP